MALITGAGLTAAMAVAGPAAATAAPMVLPSGCGLSLSTVTCTYTYTGGEQDFAVPAYVSTVDVTAIGAAGGSDSTVHAGGTAEEAHAVLSVTPGATLYVEVGGPGLDTSAASNAAGPAGGFNGGGNASGGDNTSISSASGGGASDVRTTTRDGGSLASRLIVAGGGGGASSCGAGGDAGEPGQGSQPCQTSYTGGGAGTTTMGGAADYPAAPGVQSQGGNGGYQAAQGSDTANLGGGGGGGGYYGGGGGGPTAGGGGGSSYVPPGAMNTITPTASAALVSISYPAAMLSIATHRNITVDATSPAGVVFHYMAPAVTDQANPTDPPPAVCVPPSGSTFAIATTTVTCTATDAADSNSPVSTTFTVTVVGAPGQLHVLHYAVRDYGPALANTVLIAEHAVDTENTPRACLALDAFIIEVQTRIPPLPPVTRAYLIAAAAQIQAVLACGDSWLP